MQDGSSNQFQHNVITIWNTAVGGVCLMLMSAIMAVFAWRIIQAKRQNKSWYVSQRLAQRCFGVQSLLFFLPCNGFAVTAMQFITAVMHHHSLTNEHATGQQRPDMSKMFGLLVSGVIP